jgi:single-strand DNA-binding protein
MSNGYQKYIAIGNLGADPELKVTQGGQTVLKLRMAVTEKYKDKNGELQEATEWVSGALWGKRAEALAKILKVGDRIMIEGKLKTSSYEKDGEKRYRTEVNVNEVVLCGGGKGEQAAPTNGRTNGKTTRGPSQYDESDAYAGADEIPF